MTHPKTTRALACAQSHIAHIESIDHIGPGKALVMGRTACGRIAAVTVPTTALLRLITDGSL